MEIDDLTSLGCDIGIEILQKIGNFKKIFAFGACRTASTVYYHKIAKKWSKILARAFITRESKMYLFRNLRR